MQLNPKQPYATIVGHEWARFEQNGILFDSRGSAREAAKTITKAAANKAKPVAAPAPAAQDTKVENAMEFLRNLLAGGPIDKSVVFKEAENNCQDWETVKTAFAQMNGANIKRGPSTLWRLNTEAENN
jgi:hypothetical protein